MPQINQIKYPHKVVETKVNYFIDQIGHFISYTGSEWQFEIETQQSIIEKILFRLSEDEELRLDYLDNYFQNPVFGNKQLWENYKHFDAVDRRINEYNSLKKNEKDRKKQILDSSKFLSDLKELLVELNHLMPNNLATVVSLLTCTHPLEEHAE